MNDNLMDKLESKVVQAARMIESLRRERDRLRGEIDQLARRVASLEKQPAARDVAPAGKAVPASDADGARKMTERIRIMLDRLEKLDLKN